jgi:hypothetical protein
MNWHSFAIWFNSKFEKMASCYANPLISSLVHPQTPKQFGKLVRWHKNGIIFLYSWSINIFSRHCWDVDQFLLPWPKHYSVVIDLRVQTKCLCLDMCPYSPDVIALYWLSPLINDVAPYTRDMTMNLKYKKQVSCSQISALTDLGYLVHEWFLV